MALAFVSTGTVSDATGTATTTSLGTTATGQLIVVSYADDSAGTTTFTSMTDNATTPNTYTAADSFRLNAVTYRLFYAVVTTANAAHTVRVNWSTAAASRGTVVAQYFNGFTGVPTIDQATGGTGTGTSANTGITTGATINANEIVVVGAAHAATVSAFSLGAGYTNLGTVSVANAQIAQESKVVAATGTQTGVLTIAASRAWASSIATFYDLVAAGNPPQINNYQFVKVGNGMSASEKIK